MDHGGWPPGGADLVPASMRVPGEAGNHAAFIWSVADFLRGDCKRSEYGKVILPLTVLRRLDGGILAPTKRQVLERHEQLRGRLTNFGPVLTSITSVQF